MFITDNIDLEQAKNYILTIRISSDFFSFYIEDHLNKKDHCYGEQKWEKDANILTEIQQIIFENNFLTLSFLKTNVIFVSENYELIPTYLLEKDKIKALYNFTHSSKSNRVLQAPLKVYDNYTLFDANDDIYKFLIRSLSNPIFHHHIPLVLTYIKDTINPIIDANWVIINCHNLFIDIFSFSKSHALEYNKTLHNEKDIDCLYYIMNFWSKLNLNQETDVLYVISDMNNIREPLVNSLKRYIRNVRIIDFNANNNESLSEQNNMLPSLDLITI